MNSIHSFLVKLKFYFLKIITDIRNKTFDFDNREQNIYLAIILIIIGTFGMLIS
jgi:hypothetical protein